MRTDRQERVRVCDLAEMTVCEHLVVQPRRRDGKARARLQEGRQAHEQHYRVLNCLEAGEGGNALGGSGNSPLGRGGWRKGGESRLPLAGPLRRRKRQRPEDQRRKRLAAFIAGAVILVMALGWVWLRSRL